MKREIISKFLLDLLLELITDKKNFTETKFYDFLEIKEKLFKINPDKEQ